MKLLGWKNYPLIFCRPIAIAPSFWLRPGWINAAALLQGIKAIAQQAPSRHLQVPGGQSMSDAMTNCGRLGWVADAAGYRCSTTAPSRKSLGLPCRQAGKRWRKMRRRLRAGPALCRTLAWSTGTRQARAWACIRTKTNAITRSPLCGVHRQQLQLSNRRCAAAGLGEIDHLARRRCTGVGRRGAANASRCEACQTRDALQLNAA